jgi:hypothetical protein
MNNTAAQNVRTGRRILPGTKVLAKPAHNSPGLSAKLGRGKKRASKLNESPVHRLTQDQVTTALLRSEMTIRAEVLELVPRSKKL